ncbi:hypothetical protein VM1G_04916 [Cytospora mali]|uniref:Uncharacterized protein n=1 Tax=Cytospora mali TaxID=578113 RepID=A0A194VZL8_CYTMA|nr:hypothetical protein VM1G_04916 [Valsa mali]
MANIMVSSYPGSNGPAGFPANLTDRHANEVARVASDGSVTHEEIIVVAQQTPSSTLRSNSSAMSSSEDTMQNSPEYTFQGAPRPNPKSGSRGRSRGGPANGEPSSSTAGQKRKKRKNRPDPSTSDEAPHGPPVHRRRVLEYCTECTARKSNGGNKKHHCEDCKYVKTDTDSLRASGARSTTEGPTSQTKAQKLYCEECTARKNEPGEGDHIRKNAKHKCAKCREVRGQAVSPEESNAQLQPRPEAEIEGPVGIDNGEAFPWDIFSNHLELQPLAAAENDGPMDVHNGEAAPWDMFNAHLELQPLAVAENDGHMDVHNGEAAPWDMPNTHLELQPLAVAENDEPMDVHNDEAGFWGRLDWTVPERAQTQTPMLVEIPPEPVPALGPAFNPWGSDVFLCPDQLAVWSRSQWPWPDWMLGLEALEEEEVY